MSHRVLGRRREMSPLLCLSFAVSRFSSRYYLRIFVWPSPKTLWLAHSLSFSPPNLSPLHSSSSSSACPLSIVAFWLFSFSRFVDGATSPHRRDGRRKHRTTYLSYRNKHHGASSTDCGEYIQLLIPLLDRAPLLAVFPLTSLSSLHFVSFKVVEFNRIFRVAINLATLVVLEWCLNGRLWW